MVHGRRKSLELGLNTNFLGRLGPVAGCHHGGPTRAWQHLLC